MKMSIKITDALDSDDDADDLEGIIEVIVDDIICDMNSVLKINLSGTSDGITFNVSIFADSDYRYDLTNDEINTVRTMLNDNYPDFGIEITISE